MKSKHIKWILPVLFLMILISCTLEEPVLPTWIAEWGIPYDAGFTMKEVLDDSKFITDTTQAGNAIISISISDTSEKKNIESSDLGIKPDEDSASDNIDDLTLGTQGPTASSMFDLTSILGGAVNPGTVVIPPDMTTQIDLIYLLYYDIRYAHIETGIFQIELVNNTPLDFDSGTQITIYNDSTNTLIGVTNISQMIPANSSALASSDIPLDDEVIHQRFRLVMDIPIVAGTKDITQEDIDNSTSWINGTLKDLTVIEAEARFPEQTLIIEDSSSIMDEEHRIRKATIDEGQILLTIENNLEAIARAKVKILNFINVQTGEAFTDSIILPPKSVIPRILSVANYRIADYPDSNSGELIDYIYYQIDVVTDSTESYARIHQDDEVVITVQPDSLFFRSIEGVINEMEIEIEPIVKDDFNDLSKVDGTIYLDSLEMKLNMHNETNFPIDITLMISGSDGTRDVELAPINATIPRADEGGYLQIRLSKNDPSPNIVDLMGILPTYIKMESNAVVDGEGSVETGQTFQADYQIYSPLFIRILEPSSVDADIIEENMTEDTQNQIKNNIKSAYFLVDLLNGLPVGSQTFISVANDSTKLFNDAIPDDDSTKFTISDIEIAAGHIGADGYVDTPESGNVNITLDENKRKLFYQNDTIYIGSRIILNDTNNELVKFRPEDEMSILGFFRFDLLMNNE